MALAQIRGPQSSLGLFARGDIGVERGGLFARNGERSPRIGAQVFREEDDLPDVVGIMSDLAIDRLHNGMRFAANVNSFCEVGVGERLKRAEGTVPTRVPLLH